MAAFVVLLLVTAGWLISCRIWPYTDCRRCKGKPKDRSPSGKNFRHCSKCGGSGRQLRFGATLFADKPTKKR